MICRVPNMQELGRGQHIFYCGLCAACSFLRGVFLVVWPNSAYSRFSGTREDAFCEDSGHLLGTPGCKLLFEFSCVFV